MRGPLSRAPLFAALVVAAAATACSDPGRLTLEAAAPLTLDAARTHGDSAAVGFFARHPARSGLVPGVASRSAAPTGASAGTIVKVTPGWTQGAIQPGPITAVLSGTVTSVKVTGFGAILCNGTYGTLVAYDASGATLGSSPLSLIDPSDCGSDSLTYGAQGTVAVTAGNIASFTILPMSPVEFPVNGVGVGRATAVYSVLLDAVFFPPDMPPRAYFTYTCSAAPLTCTFDGSPSSDDIGVVSYAWKLGNGTSARGKVVTATYPKAGPYSVTLTVADRQAQSSTITLVVQAGQAPGMPPVATFTSNCVGLQCVFDSGPSYGSSPIGRYWQFGDGTTGGNAVAASHTYAAPGAYAVALRINDWYGLISSYAAGVTVGIPSAPIAIGLTPDCSGPGTCTFATTVAGSNPPFVLGWKFGDGTTAGNVANPTHVFPAAGEYTVLVSAKDATGATGARAMIVTVSAPPPDAAPTARFTATCIGQPVAHQCVLDASGSTDDVGIVSYNWSWGNGRFETKASSTTRNTWATGGTYTVALTVVDTRGHTDVLVQSVVVP